VTVAKAYRLLHAILGTAADDGLIRRNPCRIKGAGEEYSPERPVVPLAVLMELLDGVPIRYRAMLLLATFASLRFGELAALRRCDLDLAGMTVRVVRSTAEMDDGRLIDDDPKSHARRRVVSIPQEIVPELRWHLECFAQAGDDGLVFVGPFGGRLRRSNFRDLWIKARDGVGLPGAASARFFASYGEHDGCGDRGEPSGADERMGHSSTRAAMIYQHATRERDEAIATAMGEALTRAREARGKADRARNGLASSVRRPVVYKIAASDRQKRGCPVRAGHREAWLAEANYIEASEAAWAVTLLS
jgi:integrase